MEGEHVPYIGIKVVDLTRVAQATHPNNTSYLIEMEGALVGYPKAKLIAHLEKSLNAFIAKTKKEEML